MNDPNTMTMLYKVADGSVQDQHYGASQSPTFPLTSWELLLLTVGV